MPVGGGEMCVGVFFFARVVLWGGILGGDEYKKKCEEGNESLRVNLSFPLTIVKVELKYNSPLMNSVPLV